MSCDALLGIFGIGCILLMAGYWLAAQMNDSSPVERLATASLVGLSSLLFVVSVENLFSPIKGLRGWLCLLPCALTIARLSAGRMLVADCQSVLRSPKTWLVLLAAVTLLTMLLHPLAKDPSLIFYDGSGNHDNFLRIAGAESLKLHSYMRAPPVDAAHPFLNVGEALAGWQPSWGRMGSEGLLALLSLVRREEVVRIYTVGTAALFIPWLAAVYLVLRTFISRRLGIFVLLAAVFLQPIFIFFHSNGNLCNLLGALLGATMVVGVERILRESGNTRSLAAWCGAVLLSTHALFCTYPEMIPFVFLPCGLLCIRAALQRGVKITLVPAAALIAGAIINPVTCVRGIGGFAESFRTANHEPIPTFFDTLDLTALVPALTSLGMSAAPNLGAVPGAALSLLLVVLLVLTIARARDPFGSAALLSGAAVLLLYTSVTGFGYGWQKTVQFGGVFIAAIFPAGCLVFLLRRIGLTTIRGVARLAAAVVILFFYGHATLMSCLDADAFATHKGLTRDMLALRDRFQHGMLGHEILVVSETFSSPFFHSIWASYLFQDARLIFSSRTPDPGGYLNKSVAVEPPNSSRRPDAVYVSHPWAETIDANSHRLIEGTRFALLDRSNRVLQMRGFHPPDGVPQFAAAHAAINLLPHRDSWLRLVLRLRAETPSDLRLQVERRLAGEGRASIQLLREGPPWEAELPLKGGLANEIAFDFIGQVPSGDRPFVIDLLRISDEP